MDKVSDMITLIVENQEESSYMIQLDTTDMVASLPCAKTSRESWIQAANSLLNHLFGLPLKTAKQVLLYRVWSGDDSDCYYHIIFLVTLSRDVVQRQKKHSDGGTKLVWKTATEVGKTEFVSPEMLAYFSSTPQEQERRMKIFEPTASVLGSFIEMAKEHIFIGPAVKEVYEHLVVDSWSPQDQMLLIHEYQVAVNPSILMGFNVFKKFVSVAGITEDNTVNLFRAADVTVRGALTCKEFLCIIAFLEPTERTQMASIEAEARYTFRFFNKRKNGVWNSSELETFFTELRKKYKATPVLDKDVAKFYRDSELSPGADVTLLQFIKAVTSSKFKIPPGFLKNNNKMSQTFLNQSGRKQGDAGGRSGVPISSALQDKPAARRVPEKVMMDTNHSGNKYSFAYHVIKINKTTNPEHVTMDNFQTCMSNMAFDQVFLGKEQSTLNFSYESPFNEVIMGLKYFANSVAPNGKTKAPFTWERVEFNHLGELLIRLSNLVTEIFRRESRLLRLSAPVYVLGDIHGNFVDLWLFENAFWPSGMELLTGGILMLGDYVDRGPHGVEVIAYLFANKIKSPKRLHMVRGNHEIRHVQKQFTFFTECQKKFGKELGQDVWKAVNNAFDYLPLAAVVDDVIFGCHGGVPPPWLCPNITVIDNIPMPLSNPDSQSPLAWELLWNDPIRDAWMNDAIRTEISMNDGFAVNKRRGTAHMFSAQALDKFLKINKLCFAIRAHEVVDCGFKLMQNGKMATIFSTSYYSGMTNKAACIMIQDGKIRVISLVTDEFHKNEIRKDTVKQT